MRNGLNIHQQSCYVCRFELLLTSLHMTTAVVDTGAALQLGSQSLPPIHMLDMHDISQPGAHLAQRSRFLMY